MMANACEHANMSPVNRKRRMAALWAASGRNGGRGQDIATYNFDDEERENVGELVL